MIRHGIRAAIPLVSTLLAAIAVTAFAADDPANNADPAELKRRLQETEKKLHDLKAEVESEQQQLDATRRALDAYQQSTEAELSKAQARGGAGDSSQPTPVGQAPSQPSSPGATAQIFQEPTALTPRGNLVVEPSAQYVHSTNNQVALVGYTILPALTIGLIDIQRIESNLEVYTLTARYGLLPRLELEVKVPYVQENTSTETRELATASEVNSFFNSSGSGLGDVEVALRSQLNHFHGDNVVWIGSLRFKSDTGTNIFEIPLDAQTGLQTKLATGSGFNAVQPGFTVLFPSDPAIFFGGVAYTYSFSRNVGFGYGDVEPGGILDLSAGMGLALNEKASFSIGYQHSVVYQTNQTSEIETGRALTRLGTIQLGTLRFGIAYRITEALNLNTTLGVGVTRDTPDLEVTIRLPYNFK
jgi:hypothetical protein